MLCVLLCLASISIIKFLRNIHVFACSRVGSFSFLCRTPLYDYTPCLLFYSQELIAAAMSNTVALIIRVHCLFDCFVHIEMNFC